MYCRNCGQKMADGDRFCSACGTKAADFDTQAQQESEKDLGFVSHPEENTIERPAPFSFSTDDLFSKKEPEKTAAEPIPPVEDFDWNIHSFPGMKVEKTEDIDFQWSSELLEEDTAADEPKTEPAALDPFNPIAGAEQVKAEEVPAEEDAGSESLEQILFGGLDSKTDEAKKQSEKIDKFFTFNQKNEEFQRLLDQEYEKIKSGNILAEEMTAAETTSAEKFEAIQPEDPMEHLFEKEGIIKGYQPKEVTTDVLERIEAADAEKAAREEEAKAAAAAEQEEENSEADESAAAEEISIAEVAEAIQEEDEAAAAETEAFAAEPLNIQGIFEDAEGEEETVAEVVEEEQISEPEAEPEFEIVSELEEAEIAEKEIEEKEETEIVIEAAAEPEMEPEFEAESAELKEAPEEIEDPVAESIDITADSELAAAQEEDASTTEIPDETFLEAIQAKEPEIEEIAEETPIEIQMDDIAEPAEEAEKPLEISMEEFLKEELVQEEASEIELEAVDLDAEEAAAERIRARAEAEAAIAEAEAKAARAREELEKAAAQEEERRAAAEQKMLKERYTSADHLSEMAKAREAFFTEEFDNEFKAKIKEESKPLFTEPAAEPEADYIEEPIIDRIEELEIPEISLDPVEIDFSQIPEGPAEEDLGQTRAFDKEAILAGMAAATRIVSQDKITEAQEELEEAEPEAMEIPDVFEGLDLQEASEYAEPAEELKEEVTADTLVMSEEMLAEILEQADFDEPEEEQESEAEEIQAKNENILDTVFEEEPTEIDGFDFSEPEYAVAEEELTVMDTMPSDEQVAQVVEEQLDAIGAQDNGEVDMGFVPSDFEQDDYEEEKGGKGRIVLKVLLVILILLLIMEIAGVAIKIAAPTSGAATFIDTQLNKVIQLITGDETEYSVIAATEPIRTEAVADKTGMIQNEMDKNSNNNIQTIKYNAELAFDSQRTYEEGDLSLTQNLTDVFWYKDADNNPVYYDESAIGGVIAFESQKMNLINSNDKSVMSLVQEGTELYTELEELADADKEQQTFRTLEIGEIREAGSAFYVWVSEDIDGDADGTADGTAANKVYMLQPEGKVMKVIDCYNV